MPARSSASRIRGTAAAASFSLTVTRTSSDPARASEVTWATVPAMSAVSVLVIDWTTIGAAPPTVTEPTMTGTERRRTGSGMGGPRRIPRHLIAGSGTWRVVGEPARPIIAGASLIVCAPAARRALLNRNIWPSPAPCGRRGDGPAGRSGRALPHPARQAPALPAQPNRGGLNAQVAGAGRRTSARPASRPLKCESFLPAFYFQGFTIGRPFRGAD